MTEAIDRYMDNQAAGLNENRWPDRENGALPYKNSNY